MFETFTDSINWSFTKQIFAKEQNCWCKLIIPTNHLDPISVATKELVSSGLTRTSANRKRK